jgi:acetylornithine deacetylase/succinyl-diaminopimelate desuccinylase-like protein
VRGTHRAVAKALAVSSAAAAAGVIVVLCGGCATVPPPPAAPEPAQLKSGALLEAMDWKAAGDEAFDDLRLYLMAPTTNPPGNERPGAEVLKALLEKDGIEVELWPLGEAPMAPVAEPGDGEAGAPPSSASAPPEGAPPEGAPPESAISNSNTAAAEPQRVNLVARLKPDGPPREGPLCLVSHMDVVTAEEARWPAGQGPYSGAITRDERGGEVLWGRGALDMKGMGLLEVEVLRWLKRLEVKLAREVIVLAVADEEVASAGMIDAIERRWDELRCTHAINEGGLGVRDALFEGQTAFTISVGEKGVLWVRMKAEGPPGHGSTPVDGRAPGKLLEAMTRVARREDEPVIHPALYELLAASGREKGGVEGFILERPTLVDWLVLDRLLSKPLTRAIINDTVNLTGYGGAEKPNVVPSEVYAQYDIRLLPGRKPAEVLTELKALVGEMPGVSFEVLDERLAAVSEWDDPVYRTLAHHAVAVAQRHGEKRVVAGPLISPGFTDSILLRAKGVRAYGFVPFIVTAEEAATMHGDGERVSKENVTRGLETLLRAVIDVSAR